MTTRTLYFTPLCPFCRKTRMELAEKDIEYVAQEEHPWERRSEFLDINPAGDVPVLQDGTDAGISESQAISEYLEESFPKRSLLGKGTMQRAEVRRLVLWFDRKFNAEVTRNLLYEKYFKHKMRQGEPYSDAIRAGKANILVHLDYIGYLTEQRDWLAGPQITLADIAAAAHLSSLDYFGDVPWEHNVRAKEWYALMKSRPSFRHIMKERVPGFRPPAHYDNVDF